MFRLTCPRLGMPGKSMTHLLYLGFLAATTRDIALGVASIVLPLRHPAHVAKAAASADVLSGGRLLLGVASGDRPGEYPAVNMEFATRGDRFRDSVDYIRAMAEDCPCTELARGSLTGRADMLRKPPAGRLPLLITGGSQQSPNWVAQNGDGRMTCLRNPASQGRVVGDYRRRITEAGGQNKPVMQSLYVDVLADQGAEPRPIHLGFASEAPVPCGNTCARCGASGSITLPSTFVSTRRISKIPCSAWQTSCCQRSAFEGRQNDQDHAHHRRRRWHRPSDCAETGG